MIKTDELISEAISLPTDIRALIVNKLLESLNPTKKEIDELWAAEAEKRVEDIRTGKVKPIPGEEVFEEIRDKYKL
ncbi:MAG: addiction module protein [Nitrospira sp.]|nr:addiction module protein [bacterium]MBL7049068.1 addiction module protein [Nitrospira sp.]